MSAVTTIVVGFLILDNFGKKFSFGSSVAKQVKHWGDVAEFNVKLNEVSDVGLFFFGKDACPVGFEVEGFR